MRIHSHWLCDDDHRRNGHCDYEVCECSCHYPQPATINPAGEPIIRPSLLPFSPIWEDVNE